MNDTKLSRNDLCHCGSGKKYKKCCLEQDELREQPSTTSHSYASPRPVIAKPSQASIAAILSDAPVVAVATRRFARPSDEGNPPSVDSVQVLPVEVHIDYTYREAFGMAEVGYIFKAGRVFLLENGQPILNDNLRPGMKVQLRGGRLALITKVDLTYRPPEPPKTHENGLTLSRVIGTVKHRGNVVMDVSWPGYTATGTPDHRYYSVSKQAYVPAIALRPGELLRTPEGATVPVLSVSPPRRGMVDLYNVEVEHFHNYFVGGKGGESVLVHNGLNCIDTPVDLDDADAAAEIESGFQTTISEAFPYGEYKSAAEKGYPGIGRTAEGGPDFAGTDYLYPVDEGQSNIVKIKYTGQYSGDYDAAVAAAGLERTPRGYSWHHVDDFDTLTGEGTLQLVQQSVHEATFTHYGGVAQYEAFNNVRYR